SQLPPQGQLWHNTHLYRIRSPEPAYRAAALQDNRPHLGSTLSDPVVRPSKAAVRVLTEASRIRYVYAV
ncbi:MAG: hypothetical protein OEU26_11145, partial [Candidatus Tectomicrobia bacterium]|nr:hypothetical protein [Candidatus Tectomicrobia bacterium]